MKKVLVACEESQTVCMAFRKRGFEAYSCDLLECSGGHPEWHIQNDVLPLLNGDCSFKTMAGTEHQIIGKWDLLIAHPPCTHLAVSGARWFSEKQKDFRQQAACVFFMFFALANCPRIAVENPVGIMSTVYRKPDQIIQPWMFDAACNVSKSTCLWLKGLPKLIPSINEPPKLDYVSWVDKKTGKIKRQSRWYTEAWKLPSKERSRVRSRTFDGIAEAMAEQWGAFDE